MASTDAHMTEDRDDLAALRRVRSELEKRGGWLTSTMNLGRKALGVGAAKMAPAAAEHAAVSAAGKTGFKAGLSEFKAGLRSGARFGIGSEHAAQAAPSLWRSVGHNVADQAVGGAISGAVLGAGLGAYQAPKGQGMQGAFAGATSGAKAGIVGGALAGGAGGAMRHGRYKALLNSGQTHDAAMKVMSKSPLQNAKDAWANRANPGAWQADALEAAAVPATLYAENAAMGIGEMKQEKTASVDDQRLLGVVRAARKIASEGHHGPQLVVVPVLRGKEKTPEEIATEKRLRDQYENDTAISRAVGPLLGTIGTEAMLRTTVDPHVRAASPTGALSMLTPDSVPRKLLLPGLGAALGGYAAHHIVQARREYRERQAQAEREAAKASAAQATQVSPQVATLGPSPVYGSALVPGQNG